MTKIKTFTLALISAATLGFAVLAIPLVMPPSMTASAQAQDAKSMVDAAKARGEVGERVDGYLGIVGSASAEVKAAVDEINIRRKSVYTRLADEQNVAVSVVAALSGEKLVGKAKAGEKIMDSSGSWTTK